MPLSYPSISEQGDGYFCGPKSCGLLFLLQAYVPLMALGFRNPLLDANQMHCGRHRTPVRSELACLLYTQSLQSCNYSGSECRVLPIMEDVAVPPLPQLLLFPSSLWVWCKITLTRNSRFQFVVWLSQFSLGLMSHDISHLKKEKKKQMKEVH